MTWGSRGSGDGQFLWPRNMIIDASRDVAYVADGNNHRVCVCTLDGAFLHKWGCEGSGDDQFRLPDGLAFTPAGKLVVVDVTNYRLLMFS